MSDFPIPYAGPLNILTTFHPDSLGASNVGAISTSHRLGAGSSNAFTANEAWYHPFVLRQAATALGMFYIVGAAAAGTVDLGIYDASGRRIVSTGATAQGTINTLQYLDITDTALGPGRYFMAILGSSASGTRFGTSISNDAFMAGLSYRQSVGASTLPTSATWIDVPSALVVHIQWMGVNFDPFTAP